MFRARYTARCEDDAIVVEDRDLGRSVTNDAENVIADLRERGFNLLFPVIYCDTTRRWDGLTVRDGQFAGFYPLNAAGSTDYGEARAKLRAMRTARDERLGDARPPEPDGSRRPAG